MGTVTNLQVASFTLGLLGIVSSLLVLMGPRPQVLDRMNRTPSQDRDFHSNKTCLQGLLSLDGGFSKTVDEAFGFPGTVLFTSIVHIFAHASLLYGAIQSDPRNPRGSKKIMVVCVQSINDIMVYAIYQIITYPLCAMYVILAVWFVPTYEYFLFAMCLWPMESVPILYAQSVTLAVCVFFTRVFLVCYIKEAAKLAPQNKIDDQVSVISV